MTGDPEQKIRSLMSRKLSDLEVQAKMKGLRPRDITAPGSQQRNRPMSTAKRLARASVQLKRDVSLREKLGNILPPTQFPPPPRRVTRR